MDKIRKATSKEIDFYENVLYPFQDEVFKLFKSDEFYLSGGTCLSRYYYEHRYSDDLDFFFDGFSFPEEKFDLSYRKIVNRLSKKFQVEVSLESDYFKRIILYKDKIPLKVEFIFENYKGIGKRKTIQNIQIDSKENLATNKMTTVYDRRSTKDFIDLYYLLKEYKVPQLSEWAKTKIVPLVYEDVVTAFIGHNLEGTVLMKKDIPEIEFNLFVQNLLKDLLKYARSS